MAKFYMAVLKDKQVHSAIVDLENLPAGANNGVVKSPWIHGADLVHAMSKDVDTAAELMDRIAAGDFTPEVLDFITQLASFWENLPPADEEKHAILGVFKNRGDFIRTSEEVAKNTWMKFRSINSQP